MNSRIVLAALLTLAVAPVAQAQNWSGLYGGVHIGHDQGDLDWTETTPSFYTLGPFGASFSSSTSGVTGGLQAGYLNQTQGNLVFGVEGSYSILGNGDMLIGPYFPATDTYMGSVDDLATLTGKVGYAWGKWLPYIEAGVANGEVTINHACPTCVTSFTSSERQTGYVVGVGIDYMAGEKASIGLNYRHADLGEADHSGMDIGGFPESFDVKAKTHVVSLRLNLFF